MTGGSAQVGDVGFPWNNYLPSTRRQFVSVLSPTLFSVIKCVYVISWVRHANLRDCQHFRRVAIFSVTLLLHRIVWLLFTKERHGS